MNDIFPETVLSDMLQSLYHGTNFTACNFYYFRLFSNYRKL